MLCSSNEVEEYRRQSQAPCFSVANADKLKTPLASILFNPKNMNDHQYDDDKDTSKTLPDSVIRVCICVLRLSLTIQ